MIEVIFDIETKKFFNEIEGRGPAALGISVISVYRREVDDEGREVGGEMRSFWDPTVRKEDLDLMWGWFREADRIVGYNSLGFDVPALAPLFPGGGFERLPHFDIMQKVKEAFGKRVSLQAIVKETLGETKTADGAQAVEYWARGDAASLEKLKIYCEKDVETTKKVYDYGMMNKKLKFKDHWNELREVAVDFSYPIEEKPPEVQMGLF